MENEAQKELAESISQSFKSLVTDTPVAKLPEDIFTRHFLPYFSGQKTPTSAEPVFAEWVSVAGNPMSPVDIINQKDEVLFRVPALFDTGMVTQLQGRTMREIFKQYELYNNNLPQVANNFLTKALTAKSEGYTPVPLTKAQEEWNNILSRYNMGEKSNESKTSGSNDADDDLIYE